MSARHERGPVRRFTDPRVEIFEPTGVSPYYRIRGCDGRDPVAIPPEKIPNLDMVHQLAWHMALNAWHQRPTNGGTRTLDAVSPQGRGIQPMLVATTGLRNGELFALRASRVDIGRCRSASTGSSSRKTAAIVTSTGPNTARAAP